MNVLKPQKILFGELETIDNLLENVKEDEQISHILLENYKQDEVRLNGIKMEKAVVNYCDIVNSNLEGNTFIDVEFKNCNFSNT